MEIERHLFLTSALCGGQWSTSRPGRFTHGRESLQYPLNRRLCEFHNRHSPMTEGNVSYPRLESNHVCFGSSPQPVRYTYWATVALPHVMTELLDTEYTLYTRMEHMVNGSKIIDGKLERKNSLKKYKVKEEDNIQTQLGYAALFGTQLAQNMVAWQVTTNTITKIWDE